MSTSAAQIARLIARLDKAENAFSNLTTPNKQLGVAIYGMTLRNFDSKGRDFRARWPALAASTVKEKRRIGKTVMLVRTGELRSGFEVTATRDNVVLANTVPHAKFHEEGTSRMPQRKLLPSREIYLKTAVKIYEAYAKRVTGEANR